MCKSALYLSTHSAHTLLTAKNVNGVSADLPFQQLGESLRILSVWTSQWPISRVNNLENCVTTDAFGGIDSFQSDPKELQTK